MKKQFIILITLVTIIASCTIQKRKYMDGYYTHQSSKVKDKKIKPNNELIELDSGKSQNNETLIVSNSKEIMLPETKPVLMNTKAPDTSECDVIRLKNNQEINCIVTEIGTTEIRYKKCDNQNGPIIVVSKSDVFLITYKNGTVDMINSKSDAQPKNPVTNQNNNQTPEQPTSSEEQKQHPLIKKALILLITGFLLCMLLFLNTFLLVLGIIAFLVSIIFSAIALVKIKRDPKKFSGKKRAVLFLILGILFLILGPILGGTILLAML